eukprot:scaffold12369_cov97-Cylindrotheca_fusiformis.AAC.3
MAASQNDTAPKRLLREFSLTLTFVCLLSYKLLVVCDDDHDSESSSPLGVANALNLWDDVALIFILIRIHVPLSILFPFSLMTTLIAGAEILAALKGFDIPWRLAFVSLRQYKAYLGLIQTEVQKQKAGEKGADIGFGLISQSLVIASLYLTFLVRELHLLKFHRRRATVTVGIGLVALALYAFLGAHLFAPNLSCDAITRPSRDGHMNNSRRNMLLSIGKEIYIGYHQDRRMRIKFRQTSGRDWHPAVGSGKPNVVMVILESMRSDMMPFDSTSHWAHKYCLRDSPPVTPFYEKWVHANNKNTVFWPKVQSTSSFTHKALLGLLCSLYPIPLEMTREHVQKWQHKCLPEILLESGYSTKLFQGMTRNFDHQLELCQRMGFLETYGLEDILEEQPPNEREAFEKQYLSGWGSLEDKPFLEPMLKWVDEQLYNRVPFFLTYQTSASHFPYPVPRNNWTEKRFADHTELNAWLNTVSYTDEFLHNLFQKILDDRPTLSNNTLIVVVGDHGTDLLDFGRRTVFEVTQQVAFEVSLSMHSRNYQMSKLLNEARPHVRGNWSALDVAPTILRLLKIPVLDPFEEAYQRKSSGNFGQDDKSLMNVMDGRSMFQSSGSRLTLSVANPGEGLVLRDGHNILVQIKGICYMYNLQKDPMQQRPIRSRNCDSLMAMDKTDAEKSGQQEWAQLAVPFISAIRSELETEFQTGTRDPNGIIFKLLTLDTLLPA